MSGSSVTIISPTKALPWKEVEKTGAGLSPLTIFVRVPTWGPRLLSIRADRKMSVADFRVRLEAELSAQWLTGHALPPLTHLGRNLRLEGGRNLEQLGLRNFSTLTVESGQANAPRLLGGSMKQLKEEAEQDLDQSGTQLIGNPTSKRSMSRTMLLQQNHTSSSFEAGSASSKLAKIKDETDLSNRKQQITNFFNLDILQGAQNLDSLKRKNKDLKKKLQLFDTAQSLFAQKSEVNQNENSLVEKAILENLQVSSDQIHNWAYQITKEDKKAFKQHLDHISVFSQLSSAARNKVCALFTLEQIQRFNRYDAEFGYDFQDEQMSDCFFALNSLPRREIRKLIARVKQRKMLAGFFSDGDPALDNALSEKYSTDLSTPQAEMPPFEAEDLENEILHYVIFSRNVESNMQRMEMIVREICPPLESDHPKRIESLLNIMNFPEALKLYMVLPVRSLTARDTSPKSLLKPYLIDFIDDARDLLKMKTPDIHKTLVQLYEAFPDEAQLELNLEMTLETWLKEKKSLQGRQGQRDFENLKNRFKLAEKHEKFSKKQEKLGQMAPSASNQSDLTFSSQMNSQDNSQIAKSEPTQAREQMKNQAAKIRNEIVADQNRNEAFQIEEDKRMTSERTFELRAYGQFLQCMPVPGRPCIFVTLQGHPRLNLEDGDEANQDEALSSKEARTGRSSGEKHLFQKTVEVTRDKPRQIRQEQEMLDYFNLTDETSEHYTQHKAISKQLHKILHSKEDPYYNEMRLDEVESQEMQHENQQTEKTALLAFWRYLEDSKQFDCIESFRISQPVPFKDLNYFSGRSNQKTYLYRSQSDEIFWFHQEADQTISLNIVTGSTNVPDQYRVPSESQLYQFIVEGSYKDGIKSFENPLPTIIRDGEGKPIVVFTFCENLAFEDDTGQNFYPTVYFYDVQEKREIAQASGASIFLHHQSNAGAPRKTKLFLYCDQHLAEHVVDPPDDYELLHGLFKYLEPMLEASQARGKNWSTLYDCIVDFSSLRIRPECVELIEEKHLNEAIRRQEKLVSYKGLPLEEQKSCNFKPIFGHEDNFWEQWSTSQVEVQPVRKQAESNLFAVALVRHSANQFSRSIRVIEAIDEVTFEISQQEKELDEWFTCQTVDANYAKNIIKLVSKEDGTKKVHFYSKVQQEYSITDEKDQLLFQTPFFGQNLLIGSSINKKTGELTWHTFNIDKRSQSKEHLTTTISILPTYMIDFPIMCHLKQDHMHKELVVSHLTDGDEPQRTFNFGRTRFIKFLGLSRCQTDSRIAFLGKDFESGDLSICLMAHDKTNEKTNGRSSLNKWTIQQYNISPYVGLKRYLYEIQTVFFAEFDSQNRSLRNKKKQPALLFSTKTSIYFATKDSIQDVRELRGINNEESQLCKIDFIRGHSNRFWFVEREMSSETYIVFVIVLYFRQNANQWNLLPRPIFTCNSGSILALVHDQDYPNEVDSYWTNDNELKTDKQVINQLFVLTSAMVVFKLRQTKDQYQVLKRIEISEISGISKEIKLLQETHYPKVFISSRCITIRGKNFIYETGHITAIREENNWTFFSSQGISHTCLQLHVTQKKEDNHNKFQLILKENPGSRKCPFLGKKSQRDVLLCGFIAEDKMLFKMRTDRKSETYWTLIDASGKIYDIPRGLRRILMSDDWVSMKNQPIINMENQLLIKSKERFAAIRFSDKGEYLDSVVFSACHPEINLIANKFHGNYSGELFQIAIVSEELKKRTTVRENTEDQYCRNQHKMSVQRHFKNGKNHARCDSCNKKIVIDAKNASYLGCDQCVYDVCRRCVPQTIEMEIEDPTIGKSYRLEQEDKDLIFFETQHHKGRMLTRIFLRPSIEKPQDRESFTQFVICGDYLCWRAPHELRVSVVNVRKMTENFKSPFDISAAQNKHVIDLQSYFDQKKIIRGSRLMLQIEACSPLYALHGTSDEKFSEGLIIERTNSLQVSFGSRALVFDLAKQTPTVEKEMDAMNHLYDQQNYVETGCIVQKMKKIKEKSGTKYQLIKSIRSNFEGSYYYCGQQKYLQNYKIEIQEDSDSDKSPKQLSQSARGLNRSMTQKQRRKKSSSLTSFAKKFNRALSYVNKIQSTKPHLSDESPTPFLGCFRSYCELDLIEFRRLQDLFKAKKSLIMAIDRKAIFSTIRGQSIFSIFDGKIRLYKVIYDCLARKNYVDKLDNDDELVENPHLRRVCQILNQKSEIAFKATKDDKPVAKCTSILQRSLKQVRVRDQLLQIANLCPNFSLFEVVSNLDETNLIVRTATPLMIEMLNTCFVETKSTKRILPLEWPAETNSLVFRHNDSTITHEGCVAQIHKANKNKDVETILSSIKVRKFDMSWLFRDGKNFTDLVEILNVTNKQEVLATEFVKNLSQQFWKQYKIRLICQMFVPFSLYGVLSIAFMYLKLKDALVSDQEDDEGEGGGEGEDMHPVEIRVLSYIVVLFWIYQVFLEVKQFDSQKGCCKGLKDHFTGLWNLNDMIHLSIVLLLVVITSAEKSDPWISHEIQIYLAALASQAICIKFYDWLRLFERTSFYINLIGMTISEIKYFLILYIISLLIFGLPLLIISLSSQPEYPIFEQNSKWQLVNMSIHQYQMSLGSFYYESYSHQQLSTLVWIYFFLSTAFTQITMLNMLIAIMGDTFDKVTESAQVYTTGTTLQILGDYSRHFTKPEHDGYFLFVMTVNQQEDEFDEQEQWEGAIKTMRKFNQRQFTKLNTKFDSKVKLLKDFMADMQAKDQAQDREDKEKINKMVFNNQTIMTQRFDDIINRLKLISERGMEPAGIERQHQQQKKLVEQPQVTSPATAVNNDQGDKIEALDRDVKNLGQQVSKMQSSLDLILERLNSQQPADMVDKL